MVFKLEVYAGHDLLMVSYPFFHLLNSKNPMKPVVHKHEVRTNDTSEQTHVKENNLLIIGISGNSNSGENL